MLIYSHNIVSLSELFVCYRTTGTLITMLGDWPITLAR